MQEEPRRIHPHLPVFRLDTGREQSLFYTPGIVGLAQPAEADALEAGFRNGSRLGTARLRALAASLEERARAAADAWRHLTDTPFQPECLTVYLSNYCNLACGYCYASAGGTGHGPRRTPRIDAASGDLPLLDLTVVEAAADLVARSCRRQDRRFTFVVHGGGEPTVHWELLQQAVALTRDVAARHDLGWWGYLATNGMLSPAKVKWLAANFDHIGLSCDGPPDIHDRQRPGDDGKPSSQIVAGTAAALRDAGARYTIRATVRRSAVARQAEIVLDLHTRLGAIDIQLEPAYRISGDEALSPADAEWFTGHFLAAQAVGQELDCAVALSGVRPDEIHGPHCNVLRQVLHLTPDGAATACFLATDGRRPDDAGLVIGEIDEATGRFVLDHARIGALRRRAAHIPSRCHDCVNVYHCARDCPDVCPVADGDPGDAAVGGFRCRVQKQLTERWLRRAIAGRGTTSPAAIHEIEAVVRFMRDLPFGLDAARLVDAWQAARARYPTDRRLMPRPRWAERGFDEPGDLAWRLLRDRYPGDGHRAPLAIYVHLPFCDRRCGFCDCYTLMLPGADRTREARYLAALLAEVEAWRTVGPLAERPLTTVHFGGGTPTVTRSADFERLLSALRTGFRSTRHTEWAVESTSSELTVERLGWLVEQGIRRLHVGIQTLDDRLRQELGRKEDGRTALERLAKALELGFVVSVDLLLGIPGQPPAGLLDDVARLATAGVHGLSVYRLNATQRNLRFARLHPSKQGQTTQDLLLFAAAEQSLRDRGFRKTHFAHYSRPEDRNLYYTHAGRGEDLLALGTSADGILGDYRYRHPGYADYVAGAPGGAPALEGGLCETLAERTARPVSASLMGGRVGTEQLHAVGAGTLLEAWRDAGLLSDGTDGTCELTATGSWFVGNMLAELDACISGQVTTRARDMGTVQHE